MNGGRPTLLQRRRYAVRLGADVFTEGAIGTTTIQAAHAAFADIRRLFAAHGVDQYLAGATSAVRNAENGEFFRRTVLRSCDLRLDVLSGRQEADLVRQAVLAKFPRGCRPHVIADLGGGSLEITVLDQGKRDKGCVLPIGTVRLSSHHLGYGVIDAAASQSLHDDILKQLQAFHPGPVGETAVCGGNAKALAKIFSTGAPQGLRAIDATALLANYQELASYSVEQRIRCYGVRKDRAEVLGVAAIVFAAISSWTGRKCLVSPGVGVLDGLLLAQAQEATTETGRQVG